jgi:hypothetical protein
MPTRRPRHAITETPPVQAALDELRQELGDDRLDLGELVILGAHEKLHQLRSSDARTAALRRSLANRILHGDVRVDLEAGEEVRRTGWARG